MLTLATASLVRAPPISPPPDLNMPLPFGSFGSSSGQLVAVQPGQGADIPPPGHQADPVLRQRLRRELSAREEVLRPPHRLPYR